MKAAILKEFATPLSVENMPDPVLGTGEVIVDIFAAPVLPYANEVFNGERKMLLELPIVPGTGAIGRIRAVGPDATRLKVGDWVLCDATIRSRDNATNPDITLHGLTARGDGGLHLQRYFHHGSFAEQMLIPTENAIPIGEIKTSDASKWCAITTFLVPYGGLLAANLQAGETILVSGATGHFGSACVAVALAMGARYVIAPGRNEMVLDEMVRRFGDRVIPVTLSGDPQEDQLRMQQAAPCPIDCVLDILPPSAAPSTVKAAIMTVRPYGKIVLMGGIGMHGGSGLELPYPWIMRNCITIYGQWLYPTNAPARLITLIQSGLLKLDNFTITRFPIDEVNEAVTHAAASGGAFRMTVLNSVID
ncbi:alcohol dehydrogenase catalytic domain-containing protein [Pedobacter cryoconitis]|uniref:alcohol dehydrogenase catalytic domain-containing protein n=1 Tax=Pedobacter cryoconitis TaxID=188932 RepID=UPI00160D84BC|nr:zinc-binding alcohol dehydrogenase family protein [Pedobacter cryoconitis]MBB5646471.1 alcohol dehydrogenase [Pedobacter cryoconitis]